MLTPNQEPGKDNGNGQTPPTNEPATIESLQEQIAEKEKAIAERDSQLDSIKKAQAGSDSKVTELTNTVNDLRESLKSKMTDEERIKTESEEKEHRLTKLQKDFEELKASRDRDKLDLYKSKKMAETKLSPGFSELIRGNTEQEIDAAIETTVAQLAERDKDILKGTYNQTPPSKGSATSSEMTQEKFNGMSFMEAQRFKKDNPELYEKYAKNKR
jgi:chromosome segregation ATPase